MEHQHVGITHHSTIQHGLLFGHRQHIGPVLQMLLHVGGTIECCQEVKRVQVTP